MEVGTGASSLPRRVSRWGRRGRDHCPCFHSQPQTSCPNLYGDYSLCSGQVTSGLVGCEGFLCGTRAVPYKEDVEGLADRHTVRHTDRQNGAERRLGRSWGEQMAEKDLE